MPNRYRMRNFLQSMFAGGLDSHIVRMAQSQVVNGAVILPEFVMAKDYWQEFDTLVDNFPGSFIVIAAIGFWNEDEVVTWKRVSMTREFGF